MDTEVIVKKQLEKRFFTADDIARAIRAALTELSETHAIEMRAYEATVQNQAERIRQLEAERVPLGILDSMINLVEGFPVIDWRNSETGMRIKDSSAWVEFYCAAKNAIAAAPQPKKEGE